VVLLVLMSTAFILTSSVKFRDSTRIGLTQMELYF
jgi:hypothetical protein